MTRQGGWELAGRASGPRPASTPERGATLVELVIGLGLVVTIGAMSAPSFAAAADAGRARAAAQFLAAECRRARADAVGRGRTVALAFSRVDGRWRFQRCVDGNGDGVRRADLARGADTCDTEPAALGQLFRQVDIAADAAVPDPDGGGGSADPVRFGASDLASFTPGGTATAGTVFVRSAAGVQFAVRVAGATGRTRVLRYDPGTRRWKEA